MNLVPKKILLGLQEGQCNLRCPKCYTYGTNIVSKNERQRGIMDFESFTRLLDEVKAWKPRIAPQTWDEPFMNPKLLDYLSEIKKRDLVITMDTNGLLVKEDQMKELVRLRVDSVFFSVDAARNETYKKVRGVDRLQFLKEKILKFLEIRGKETFPRIGVSFVIEEDNASEVPEFIDFWSEHADVIRVNQMFMQERQLSRKPLGKRTPCWSLYDSLMIHPNGEAALCCADTHYETKIGNVFTNTVQTVWNGHFFNKARQLHEKGLAHEISICAKCDLWSHDQPKQRTQNNLLISETTSHTYYNRIDRLENMVENRFV